MRKSSVGKLKGILLDVDGALTNRQRVVSDRTAKVITEVVKKGIRIGVATGRSYASLLRYILPFFRSDSLHIVAGGGQIITTEGNVVWERKIPHAKVFFIAKEVEAMGATYTFGQGSILYCSRKLLLNISRHPWGIETKLADGLEDWSAPLISIVEINENVRHFLNSLKDLLAREIKTGYKPPYFDITDKGVNKGSTAHIWAKKHGISLKDILAVGDSINDLELMRVVGLSAAMGQSPEKVKSAADITIGDTDKDGLAEFLENYLFK